MLVDGSVSIARRFKMPETMIGFTVIAFGTSLPKFFTVLLAAYNGFFDLVFGAIIGSCIFNILGMLSIAGFFRPIKANRNTATLGIAWLLICAFLVFNLANNSMFISTQQSLILSRNDGYILLLIFVLFMIYGYYNTKRNQQIWFDDVTEIEPHYAVWFSIILLAVGILSLIAGGVLVVNNLIDISRKFEMSQRFLGQFILSVGGSIVMLYWLMITKSNPSKFEVSNLLGQNMLNLLAMLGISAIIQPLTFNKAFNTDIFILMAVTVVLFSMLWLGKKLTLTIAKCRFLFAFLLLYILYLFIR